jgi:hypothetical protein
MKHFYTQVQSKQAFYFCNLILTVQEFFEFTISRHYFVLFGVVVKTKKSEISWENRSIHSFQSHIEFSEFFQLENIFSSCVFVFCEKVKYPKKQSKIKKFRQRKYTRRLKISV